MKITNKALYGSVLALLVFAAPFAANAGPFGHNGFGYHGGWQQALPQEKLDMFYTMRNEHREAMRPMMEDLWKKQTTLDALSRNPKVEPKEITALINDISDLRGKMAAQYRNFAERMKQETGMEYPYGGYGMNGFGPGHHGRRGGGYHKGGYGMGCAW